MDDKTDDSRKSGMEPDKYLSRHGGVPTPMYKRSNGQAEELDHTLSNIPKVKREF